MKIGGFQKVSLIDYPGRISAVVFTRGCNFRCPFCHNPELVDPERFTDLIPEPEILSFLEKRRGRLDAVVITGGEPTLQPELLPFVIHLRAMGYRIKLDTNGALPEVIEEMLGRRLLDYIAMDIKAPLGKYGEATGVKADGRRITRSISLIMGSGIEYEFRTTAVRSFLAPPDFEEIGRLKHEHHIPVLQLTRWENLLESHIAKAQKAGLDTEFIKSLFELIHAQAVKRQL